jgi:drug/metabolite transporter (DMT)-like permease
VGGAGLILWKGVQTAAPLTGFLLVELSNICFAAGQLAYRELLRRHSPQLPDHRVFFWLYLGACAVLAPLALWHAPGDAPRPGAVQLAVIAYLGVLVSGLAYYLWNSGARRVSPGVLAVANNLKIPLGVACSLLLFGERANLPGLLAGALLVCAAFIPALWPPRKGSVCACRKGPDPVS